MHLFLMIVLLVLLLILLIIIGILLDIVTGIKVRHPHLPLYQPATGMNRLRYFTDGRSLFDDMLATMDQARDHIHLSFFIFEVDHVGREWLDLLKKKAGEGVEVRLLVDALASRSMKKYEDELTRAGIQLAFSGKVSFPFTFYLLNRRNHRKIAVVDGKTGYFGGFNVSRDYIGNRPETGSWHDNHLKVTGESVAELQRLFLADWAEAGRNAQDHGRFYPHLDKGPSELTLMGSSGRQIEGLFAEKLSAAHQSITIGSPYFIPSQKLMDVLIDRLEHGVRLTILLPMKKDHPLVRPASYLYLQPLVERGAQLYHFYQGFYHSKVFIIDQSLCYIGTANFDRRSFFWNDELVGFSSDHHLIQHVTEQLETEIRNSSVLVGAETITRRSPIEKLKSLSSGWFRSFL